MQSKPHIQTKGATSFRSMRRGKRCSAREVMERSVMRAGRKAKRAHGKGAGATGSAAQPKLDVDSCKTGTTAASL